MIEKKNTQDAYKYYKTLDDKPVTLAQYRAIVNGFIKFIVRKMFDGFDVQLSNGNSLGTICVRGKKITPKIDDEGNIRGIAIDWGKTNKMWDNNPVARENKQLVYHLNEHSSGVRYTIKWFKSKAILTNKYYYSFIPCRQNKRKLPELIHAGKEYLVIEQNHV